MPAYFNIDETVKHVKTIADNNRCVTCDKLSGVRLRYPCGHTICKECHELADECLTCIDSSTTEPVTDFPQIQCVQNASNLLTAFQETFNIDVYKRYRLSEKLNLEKKLFPEPIQANIKYFNKRRSSQISNKGDKENLRPSFDTSEESSHFGSTTMNTRINLVQKWLEKNENIQSPRKPFSNINVNSPLTTSRQNSSLIKNKDIVLDNSKNAKYKKIRKSSNLKNKKSRNAKQINSRKEPSLLKQNDIQRTLKGDKPVSKLKSEIQNTEYKDKVLVNNKKDEGCTTFDNLDAIVIEDTQSDVVDNHKNTWLADLQADEKYLNLDSLNKLDKSGQVNTGKNVCFYKKGFLYKSCRLCLSYYNNYNIKHQRLNSNDASIIINTNSITTSITFSRNNKNYMKVISKHSIATQTGQTFYDEVIESNAIKKLSDKITLQEKNLNITSQDLFVDEGKIYAENEKNITEIAIEDIRNREECTNKSSNQCLVINDSDSDVDMNFSGTLEVTADVHRSREIDSGVLSTVEWADDQTRLRRAGRRPTIDSNNSSEKENVEPNRAKKLRLEKKKK